MDYRLSVLALAVPVLAILAFIQRPGLYSFGIFSAFLLSLAFLLFCLLYYDNAARQIGASLMFLLTASSILLGASICPRAAIPALRVAIGGAVLVLLIGVLLLLLTTVFPVISPESIGWDKGHWRLRTPMGGGISTGVVIIFCFVLVCYYCFLKANIVRLLALVILVIAIAASGSRAVFFSASIGIFLLLVLHAFQSGSVPRLVPMVALLIGTLVVGSILLVPTGDRFLSGFGAGGGDELRIASAELAASEWRDQPLFGKGAGLVYPIGHPTMDVKAGRGVTRFIEIDGDRSLIEPHNLYVMLLAEFGLVGLILFLMPFMITIVALLFSNAVICRVGAIGLVSVLIFQNFGSHLYIDFRIGVWVGLVSGVLLAIAERRDAVKERFAIPVKYLGKR